jgi:glycosyltransferase involved in cell wall biosynthesis
MAAAGFRVRLIAPGAPNGKVVEGVRLSSLPEIGGRAGRPLRWPILMWKALRSRADVFHFHDPELLPWGVLLHWVTRKPVIYDSHEYLREDILGKHWIPSPLRKPVATIANRVEKWSASRLSGVIAVTDEMADRFRPYRANVITVKNLPPAPTIEGTPVRRPIVIYAGLMNVERGLDILFETATLVRAEFPATEFHILGTVEWYGIDPSIASKRPGEWEAVGVHFMGTVPQPEVAPRLAEASVGWLPRNPEVANNLLAWPNKLVEYMVVSLPVVASDLPLQASVVRDAECGIVVEALSPAAHAAAIIELLRNPGKIERLGANGKRAALSLYTWEAESEKLQSLYRSLARP